MAWIDILANLSIQEASGNFAFVKVVQKYDGLLTPESLKFVSNPRENHLLINTKMCAPSLPKNEPDVGRIKGSTSIAR